VHVGEAQVFGGVEQAGGTADWFSAMHPVPEIVQECWGLSVHRTRVKRKS